MGSNHTQKKCDIIPNLYQLCAKVRENIEFFAVEILRKYISPVNYTKKSRDPEKSLATGCKK